MRSFYIHNEILAIHYTCYVYHWSITAYFKPYWSQRHKMKDTYILATLLTRYCQPIWHFACFVVKKFFERCLIRPTCYLLTLCAVISDELLRYLTPNYLLCNVLIYTLNFTKASLHSYFTLMSLMCVRVFPEAPFSEMITIIPTTTAITTAVSVMNDPPN